jgi:hypothetical protein
MNGGKKNACRALVESQKERDLEILMRKDGVVWNILI